MNLWIKLMNPLVEAFVERCVDGWRYLGISSWAIMLSRAADYTPQEVSSLFRSHDFDLVCFSVNLIPSVTFFCFNRSPRIAGGSCIDICHCHCYSHWHKPDPLWSWHLMHFFPLQKKMCQDFTFWKNVELQGVPKNALSEPMDHWHQMVTSRLPDQSGGR